MLTRSRTERAWGSSALGLAILAVGILVGALLDPMTWLEDLFNRSAKVAAVALPPGSDARDALPTLTLVMPAGAAALLAHAALQRVPGEGRDDEDDGAALDARVRFAAPGTADDNGDGDGPGLAAQLRVVGDWRADAGQPRGRIDVALERGTIFGTSAFTLRPPRARGWLWVWLLREAAARAGLLCQRSTFVRLVIDERLIGVVFLEERLAPELLAAAGRPAGPILRFEQEDLWRTALANPAFPDRAALVTCLSGALDGAQLAAFEERRLEPDDAALAALVAAQAELAAQELVLLSRAEQGPSSARQDALSAGRGRMLARCFDVDAWARMHALASVFRAQSGAGLRRQVFRAAPDGRLEPILLASDAGRMGQLDPVPWMRSAFQSELNACAAYRHGLFAALAPLLEPDFVDGLFEALAADIARFEAALSAEGLPAKQSAAAVHAELVHQQLMLAKVVRPRNAINAQAALHLAPGQSDPTGGAIEVEAWATTRAPVLVTGFRFGNGAVVPAAAAYAEGGGEAFGTGHVLADEGLRTRFRFAADQRLATLRIVEQVKEAVRTQSAKDESVRLVVDVLYRPLASIGLAETRLFLRAIKPGWYEHGSGRPAQPTVSEALARHPCLAFDAERGQLRLRAGTWDIDGDLSIPAGHALGAGPGTTLRFARGAILFATDALHFEGSDAQPVVFEPAPGEQRFGGLVVLAAEERSTWRHVVVRSTEGIERGGWLQTGAVNFFQSDVTLQHCRFEGTLAEDALNVVSADVHLDDVTILDAVSDAFDGDFVTGLVEHSTFDGSGGDGVDFSGCDIDVRTSTFRNIADKAISIGESGLARVADCTVESASIGLASKDGSRVIVDGLRLEQCANYGLAAYIKKAVYDPPVIEARGVVFGAMGRGRCIVQLGSRLDLDGATQPGIELDVKQLYAEGILGT